MKYIDERMCKLVTIVSVNDGRVDADDPAIAEFSDDRPKENGHGTDTFNLCFDGGILTQIQTGDDDFEIILGS